MPRALVRVSGVVLVVLAPWLAATAAAQPERCADALQFDTTSVQRNVAAQLSILNTVTSSNYEQMKSKLGVAIPGVLEGTFDQFSERRSQLQSSFSREERLSISDDLYQRVLSPEGARAYALCIQTNANLVAWVSSTGITNNRVAVTVRNNTPGTGEIVFTVTGATPLNPPERLTAGSEQTLYFNSPRAQDFFLVINARNPQSGASLSVPPIELPAYVEYQREPVFQDVTGTGQCGAGCQGNTSGCQQHRDANLAAPAGFTLMPDTLTLSDRRVVGGPGVAIDPPWTWTHTPNRSAPVVMRGAPGACDGASPHAQGIVDYTWTVRAVRYRVVRTQ